MNLEWNGNFPKTWKYVLAIDPGLRSGGAWTKISSPTLKDGGHGMSFENPVKNGSWLHRMTAMAAGITVVVMKKYANGAPIIIEYPQFVGLQAQKDAHKLLMLVGALSISLSSLDVPVFLVPVGDWKGQLSKKVVNERIARYFKVPVSDIRRQDQDTIDAVGMSLWWAGCINQKKGSPPPWEIAKNEIVGPHRQDRN